MADSGKPQCHYKMAIIALRAKNKNGRNLVSWSKVRHQFSTCLNSLSLQLEISYGLGTNRNGKECSSWHDDKRILSVAGVILDIVRDAETISVTLTGPSVHCHCFPSDDFTHIQDAKIYSFTSTISPPSFSVFF